MALLYTLPLAGLILGKLVCGAFELIPDGNTPGLGLIQHLFGILRKTGGDGIGLSRLEEQQIFVRPRFIKGIVHIPFPGHPVKDFGIAGQLYAVCGNAVGHEFFNALLAVGRFACPVFLGDFPANGPERIGKAPGRQLTGL